MVAQHCARAYRSNAVLTASPGRLVLMLYDGALRSLALAQDAFSRPDTDYQRIQVINQQLLKAQNILAELQGTLNLEAGGEFAQTMHGLYGFHMRRLFEANLRKEVEPVIEVERLLREIRDAWEQMLLQQDSTTLARGVA